MVTAMRMEMLTAKTVTMTLLKAMTVMAIYLPGLPHFVPALLLRLHMDRADTCFASPRFLLHKGDDDGDDAGDSGDDGGNDDGDDSVMLVIKVKMMLATKTMAPMQTTTTMTAMEGGGDGESGCRRR